ncbi:hypothetical protein PHET_04173 [Paragonimus heterotremus]|uniref:Uncharacterized protein n=1 Tax=Paragonimus heterotremus TaxID=100268 RepID=A0A8J4WHK9_9TREM|nr:hypothetical protein PHET_04173 [Paragonimus heterotremus]
MERRVISFSDTTTNIQIPCKMPSLASRGTPTFLAKSCWYICDVGTEVRATERVVAQSVLRSRQNRRMSTWMPTSNVCQVQV